ncbi:MAG TPA: SRPBCC family protein [Thermosynechococcaceae cyanobacterium]
MATSTSPMSLASVDDRRSLSALLEGEILTDTRPHTAWGAAVTARMYLPIAQSVVWERAIDYPRWVEYIPALIHSQVLNATEAQGLSRCKRIYQVASKNFILFSATAEIYLTVVETQPQRIQFRLESGDFKDFAADLSLQKWGNGTLLTYDVQATPALPFPSVLLQQGIQLDFPANLRSLRQALCR